MYIWHPNASANFYVDHHDKFGLSPINPDRVDLQRFPEVANINYTLLAVLEEGDALFIPDTWFHLVVSRESGAAGGNIAVSIDFVPYVGKGSHWPPELIQRKQARGALLTYLLTCYVTSYLLAYLLACRRVGSTGPRRSVWRVTWTSGTCPSSTRA